MGARDIMPYRSDQIIGARSVIIGTSAAYDIGEPVRIDANGNLVESTDNAVGLTLTAAAPGTTNSVHGIACENAANVATLKASDGTTATAQNQGILVSYYPFSTGQEFITRFFATTADTLTATPDDTNVGDLCGIVQDGSGNWGISTDGGVVTNQHFVITRVIYGAGGTRPGFDMTDQDTGTSQVRVVFQAVR